MARVFLALGSNLDQPTKQLNLALTHLQKHPSITLIQCSPYYACQPQGPQDQPDFVNAVCAINTTLTPLALLDATQAIEQQLHRVKTRHWGPRTIDIDIMLYDDITLNHPQLTIPHPQMLQRDFVLKPLLDIAPELGHLEAHLKNCDSHQLSKLFTTSNK